MVRVMHAPHQRISEHRHDWACLTLPVIGSYLEVQEGGFTLVEGPSVVLHPPGAFHADTIGARGLETISMQLDPSWLAAPGLLRRLGGSRTWLGGPVPVLARKLAGVWQEPSRSESEIARATSAFLHAASLCPQQLRPSWFDQAASALAGGQPGSTRLLARQLGLNAAWLTRAYRAHAGEGMQETLRRKRVEAAVAFLRDPRSSLAEVAAAAGFCDQSHMNRSFRAVLNRTPAEVRTEQRLIELPAPPVETAGAVPPA